jgi:hypothetical protein
MSKYTDAAVEILRLLRSRNLGYGEAMVVLEDARDTLQNFVNKEFEYLPIPDRIDEFYQESIHGIVG